MDNLDFYTANNLNVNSLPYRFVVEMNIEIVTRN